MFHRLALQLGLAEPNVHDVVEKLIDMYFEDPCYINSSSTSEKQITVDGIKYDIFIVRTPDGYELRYGLTKDNTYFRKVGTKCTCQFIAEHLSEIQDILKDMANTGKKAAYERLQKEKQEKKCLTKMWRYLE